MKRSAEEIKQQALVVFGKFLQEKVDISTLREICGDLFFNNFVALTNKTQIEYDRLGSILLDIGDDPDVPCDEQCAEYIKNIVIKYYNTYTYQKIVFFGAGDFVVSVVEKIKDLGLILIVSTEKDGGLARYSRKNNIPFLCSDLSKKEGIEYIQSLNPTIGVLASYGAFVPEKVIKLFPNGILNIHPSLLPKFKGPTPIQTAILNGEKETGISIIKLDNEIDHGPILEQKKVKLSGNETSKDLLYDFFTKGAELIKNIIEKLEKGEAIKEHEQDHSKESFTEKLDRNSGKIDLSNPPTTKKLDLMVRAFYPWPGVWTTARIMNKELRIKFLPENQIQVEGKKPTNYKDFENGYPEGKEILEKLKLTT